jgi:ferritin-like metal-binding protein YciE
MKVQGLEDLYVQELKDLYSAEKQLVQALPKMAKAATSSELQEGFQKHLEQTKTHVERLETIFGALGKSPTGKKCVAMEGLIQEGQHAIELQGDEMARDAALIASAQKVEHYEIAGYGTVRTFARHLGLDDHKRLLQQTLDEEGETDKQLTELAEGKFWGQEGINEQAIASQPSSSSKTRA